MRLRVPMISATLVILVSIVASISIARRIASPTISSICVTAARFSFSAAYCSSVRFAVSRGFIDGIDRITVDVPFQIGVADAVVIHEIDAPPQNRRELFLECEKRQVRGPTWQEFIKEIEIARRGIEFAARGAAEERKSFDAPLHAQCAHRVELLLDLPR